ncbi:UNVERIFIED_CONTAM: hypothetical protein Sangu_3156900 [Sesamum angustifolium]|uniref:DUF4283 domain-containing protein n=1 Tax=Sesamum angustifolium TaxID=2727405 RepID=A0AAW2JVG0_9LAMI
MGSAPPVNAPAPLTGVVEPELARQLPQQPLNLDAPPKILIGNIPLKPCSDSLPREDKIAAAFNNSSRKMLSYMPPTLQNGEVVVRPSMQTIREGSRRWHTTAVGYFLGKRPYFHHLDNYVRSIWPMVREVTATSNGFFFFRFTTGATMEEVIEGGPWLFQGQPIVLQKWEPELWTIDGLSTVASGIGKPLYPDAITRDCTRLDFARVCVMLDISSKLPQHVITMIPMENGGESACKVDVEYEWLPPKCNSCHTLGHTTSACESQKPSKPPVSVYVQKPKRVPPTSGPVAALR